MFININNYLIIKHNQTISYVNEHKQPNNYFFNINKQCLDHTIN